MGGRGDYSLGGEADDSDLAVSYRVCCKYD